MYGWRGRIGIVLPADNTVVEPEFARVLPEGVSAHVMRLSSDQRDRMPIEAVELVPALRQADIGVLGYLCAASSFALGPRGNADLMTKLSAAGGGVPAFTATTAMVEALRAVGATRVSVLSPHPPDVAQKLREYLIASGFTVTGLTALDMSLRAINSQFPGDVYRHVKAMDHRDADAIFIAATNFRALEVVSTLEQDLGLPVVTSNQACLYRALSLLKVTHRAPGLGRLFAPARTAANP